MQHALPGLPGHRALKQRVSKLSVEISMLKAAHHAHMNTEQLSRRITTQQQHVRALTAQVAVHKGKQQVATAQTLRVENQRLRELLLGAKLKIMASTTPQPPPLVEKNKILAFPTQPGVSHTALDTESLPAQSMLPLPEATGTETQEAPEDMDTLPPEHPYWTEPPWDLGDVTVPEEAPQLWYKHPVVLIGAGVILGLLFGRN